MSNRHLIPDGRQTCGMREASPPVVSRMNSPGPPFATRGSDVMGLSCARPSLQLTDANPGGVVQARSWSCRLGLVGPRGRPAWVGRRPGPFNVFRHTPGLPPAGRMPGAATTVNRARRYIGTTSLAVQNARVGRCIYHASLVPAAPAAPAWRPQDLGHDLSQARDDPRACDAGWMSGPARRLRRLC